VAAWRALDWPGIPAKLATAKAMGYSWRCERHPPAGIAIMTEIDPAELDHAIVAYELGDYVGARRGFERAAAAGSIAAESYLGFMHYLGRGFAQSDARAALHFRHAAQAGDAKAQLNLARLHEAGRGVEQDARLAVQWYRRAAEAGEVPAMHRLAVCLYDGIGIDADPKAAVAWLLRAAEAGSLDCALAYAALVYAGEGVPPDPGAALPWARRAAAAGLPEAKTLLEAIEAKASDLMSARGAPTESVGQAALGLDYCLGRNGAPRDAEAGAQMLLLAAKSGLTAAQYDLALLYAYGYGVARDAEESARWCRSAAEAGHIRAQFRMSGLYAAGFGVAKDLGEALFWAELAARGGHDSARKTSEEIAGDLNMEIVSEARHRAESYRTRSVS
jgi:TPR repeat protein